MKNQAQNPVHILLATILLFSAVLLITATKVYDLDNFGQQLFLELSHSNPHENCLLSAFPIATLLILLRMSAEATAAQEIGEKLGLISKAQGEIYDKYMEMLNEFERNQFYAMKHNILMQKDPSKSEELQLNAINTIKSWQTLNICHRAYDLRLTYPKVFLILKTEINFLNIFRYIFSKQERKPFHTSDYKTVDKEMLTVIANMRYAEIKHLDARAYEVPYSLGDTSLVFIIPNAFRGIKDLERKLIDFPLAKIHSYMSWQWFKLQFPKTELRFESNIKEELKNGLKMYGIFDWLCDEERQIVVTNWTYRSTFSINEQNAGHDPFIDGDIEDFNKISSVVLDHPFIFFIKSSTNDIYSVGKISK